MPKIVGVSFDEQKRIYFFDPANIKNIKNNVPVIVNTERGMQYGIITKELCEVDKTKITGSLKKVIRLATNKDIENYKQNKEDAKKALDKCRLLVKKYNLNMKIIDANYTLNREQLLFHFLADNRIDFRVLAKDLASIYKTRIELRQVGVRDKAKNIGGMGLCGCSLCCSKFLNEFDSVSINMAKNQNISLNPSKINGACGRLLCCLKYEDETYEELRKELPKVGKIVETKQGQGKVISIDVLEKSYNVDVEKVGIVKVDLNESN